MLPAVDSAGLSLLGGGGWWRVVVPPAWCSGAVLAAGRRIGAVPCWCPRRRGLVELASDLVLDGLQVGLLIRIDACVAGHPEKRLTGTLCIHDFLAVTDDAEGTIGGSLVGLSLALSDSLDDFSNFNLGFVIRFQNIVNLLIAVFGDTCQFIAKLHHAVERAL